MNDRARKRTDEANRTKSSNLSLSQKSAHYILLRWLLMSQDIVFPSASHSTQIRLSIVTYVR